MRCGFWRLTWVRGGHEPNFRFLAALEWYSTMFFMCCHSSAKGLFYNHTILYHAGGEKTWSYHWSRGFFLFAASLGLEINIPEKKALHLPLGHNSFVAKVFFTLTCGFWFSSAARGRWLIPGQFTFRLLLTYIIGTGWNRLMHPAEIAMCSWIPRRTVSGFGFT